MISTIFVPLLTNTHNSIVMRGSHESVSRIRMAIHPRKPTRPTCDIQTKESFFVFQKKPKSERILDKTQNLFGLCLSYGCKSTELLNGLLLKKNIFLKGMERSSLMAKKFGILLIKRTQ